MPVGPMTNKSKVISARPHLKGELFERANEEWDKGNLRSAFRLFLAGAKAGDDGCQVNLGNFYADGIGMRPHRKAGMYWYLRAYRQGSCAAASNIAVVYRNENKINKALAWFQRAVALKDGDAYLDIAKIYLSRDQKARAKAYLKRASTASPTDITAAARKEAALLLKKLNRQL
jgi:tetratricopeptide (TPR) repeat protein